MQAVINQGEDGSQLPDLERERFLLHTDHAQVGAALLADWQLPDTITGIIAGHHEIEPDPSAKMTGRIVYLANWLENTFNIKSFTSFEEVDDGLVKNLMTTIPQVPHISENIEEIFEEFYIALDNAQVVNL